MIANIIAIAVIVLVIGGAVAYIVKSKKSGKKCIGCPESCSCSAKSKNGEGGCCSCTSHVGDDKK